MTTNYKILGQSAPNAGTETNLYQVPSSNSTMVKSINITNRSATSDTYNVAVLNNVSSVASPLFVSFGQASTSAATSTDGITWALRTLPISDYWQSATYGNNTFVAVAIYSTSAVSSTDGITWTLRTLPASANWYSATFGNNTFVAVARNSANAASSTDGITWTQRTLPVSDNSWSTTFGNNTFVAVASDTSKAATSTDGITWIVRTLPSNNTWRSVTYGEPTVVPTTQNKDYIAYNNTIAGNSTVSIKAGYTIPQNGGIRITSTNGTSTFSSFGAEIS